MSLAFPTRRAYYRKDKSVTFMDDTAFTALHWSEQEKLQPNSREPKPYRETGDFDNRTDNWDDPETYDEPQANE